MRLAFLIALFVASPALADDCLKPEQAREGVLTTVRHQMLNKQWQKFYLLRLDKPSCVLDDKGERYEKQREIGLFPRDERQMAKLVGKRVRIEGEGPMFGETQWDIRDLTIQNALAIAR